MKSRKDENWIGIGAVIKKILGHADEDVRRKIGKFIENDEKGSVYRELVEKVPQKDRKDNYVCLYKWCPELEQLVTNLLFLFALGIPPLKVRELASGELSRKEVEKLVEKTASEVLFTNQIYGQFLTHRENIAQKLCVKNIDLSKTNLGKIQDPARIGIATDHADKFDPVAFYLCRSLDEQRQNATDPFQVAESEAERALIFIRAGYLKEAQCYLDEALAEHPQNARLHYANALHWLARVQKEKKEAKA